MLRLLVAVAFIVAFNDAAFLQRRESVVDKGTHLLICKQEPIELGIVLDSSSSIRHSDFLLGIKFLQDFLEQFDIGSGRNGVRVSIISFGKGIYPQDGFNLDTYNSKEEVIEAIGKVPHRFGLYTSTGEGIQYMHESQLAKDLVRPFAERISIVITDGNSQEWKKTKAAAEAARADGIVIFAIGVGVVKDSELLNIAGDESRVTKVSNYGKLDSIKEALAYKTCIKKEKPTTTPPPKTEKCGEANPADINFVFSPSDLGVDATSWATSFISNTVKAEDMNIGFRYGVISGSCPEDEGFALNAYNNPDAIRERLSRYDRDRVPDLLERLASEGFSSQRGGRTNARKIAVLVHRGGKKGNDLRTEVDRLVEEGVQVFIADPSGNGVEVEGAITLFGRSSRQASESLITALCPK